MALFFAQGLKPRCCSVSERGLLPPCCCVSVQPWGGLSAPAAPSWQLWQVSPSSAVALLSKG